jgi:predicted P-loop ATPase
MDYVSLEHEALTYIQGDLLPHMPAAKIKAGLQYALQGSQRDLLQDMFRNLVWDGTPRLDTWGSKHFQTDFPAYADEWGRQLMIGLTLRVLEPGTKVDRACILVGAQGIGKSTFFEELATFSGYSFYHACTELSSDQGDTNRTQTIAFARSLIVDLAEGVIFETHKAKMDRAKQRITQVVDEYREVYATATRKEKRGFIFVGTTNRTDQLGDNTGNRRFLVMRVEKITKLDYFTKLQIIAEIVARESEFRDSAWYDLKVSVDDAPEELRKEHEHITDVQTLVNTQFARPDAISEFVFDLLESGEPARLKDTNEMYITAGYVSSRMGNSIDASAKNMISRILSSLSSSPSFPYKLVSQRKRLPQLAIPGEMFPAYSGGITNNQQMINGYIVTKK